MTANVKILIDRRNDVLKIPNAALRFHPQDATPRKTQQRTGATPGTARRKSVADQQMVWVMDPQGKPRPVQVTLGLTDGSYTEVSGGGLKQGDQAVVASFSKNAGASATSASPFGGGAAGTGGGRRGGF
jgi:HlyD family secretion protein